MPLTEMKNMIGIDESVFIRCPICSNKTRTKLYHSTVLENFPLFCPKCKRETLIKAKDLQVIVITEPDA